MDGSPPNNAAGLRDVQLPLYIARREECAKGGKGRAAVPRVPNSVAQQR